jgi:hypothetical protein
VRSGPVRTAVYLAMRTGKIEPPMDKAALTDTTRQRCFIHLFNSCVFNPFRISDGILQHTAGNGYAESLIAE